MVSRQCEEDVGWGVGGVERKRKGKERAHSQEKDKEEGTQRRVLWVLSSERDRGSVNLIHILLQAYTAAFLFVPLQTSRRKATFNDYHPGNRASSNSLCHVFRRITRTLGVAPLPSFLLTATKTHEVHIHRSRPSIC